MGEHLFTTYVRTKNVFKHRLKDLKDYDSVRVYEYELNKLGVNYGPLLYSLKQRGEISYDSKGNFRALRKGPTDPSLLRLTQKRQKGSIALDATHEWMKEQLKFVTVAGNAALPVYFKAFLEHRGKHLGDFFTVDDFSNRVHTPVVNLKGNLRGLLRLHGKRLVSLDVKQMQPTILAKILRNEVGPNPFSDSISKGEDVYILLQKSAHLPNRAAAKKFLFQLIFGKPVEDIGLHFKGCTDWIHWINRYKSRVEPKNPHKDEMHTNLAWLLQYSEVQVMMGIWNRLKDLNIPFLSIHDDILCTYEDERRVYNIMDDELAKNFEYYKIVVTKN